MIAQATPAQVIRDKAYDSDRLDRPLIAEGVEMIAPNRLNHSQTQDGRPCDATYDAGPSNAPSLGSKTTAAFASYGKNLISPSKASFTWPALSCFYGGFGIPCRSFNPTVSLTQDHCISFDWTKSA